MTVLALAAPRRIIAAAAVLTVALAVFGVPVANHLSPSGFQDPGSESASAAHLLTEHFGRGDVEMVIVVSSPDGVDSPAVRTVARDIVTALDQNPHVAEISSAWSMVSERGLGG